jgi:hypothetical protein
VEKIRKARRDRRAQAKQADRGKVDAANRVSALWGEREGQDCFVVGTGTSLSGFDFSKIDRPESFVIGLNDAIKIPGLKIDYSIFCDTGIWTRYRDLKLDPGTRMICQPRARKTFLGHERCTFKSQVWHFNHVSRATACNPLNDDLYVERTVATGGIMLAFKLGAARVFLLGIDGYKIDDGTPEGVYYYDGKNKGVEKRVIKQRHEDGRQVQDRHELWAKNMASLRTWLDRFDVYREKWPGSNVYNLSPRSTIDAWVKIDAMEVFRG